MDYKNYIQDYLDLERKTLDSLDLEEIAQVLELFLAAYQAGGTIYVFGNGGSASTASHMVNDFNKGISEYVDKKFRLVCLNDNVSTLMSIANDISYDEVFRFQLRPPQQRQERLLPLLHSGGLLRPHQQGVRLHGMCLL